MWRLGNWFLLILLLVLIVEILTFAPKTLDMTKASSALGTKGEAEIEQQMSGVHLVETGESSREWELWANQAITYKNTEKWKLDQVKVNFFSDETIEYNVTGDRGEVAVESKDMNIEGNIVLTTSNGYRLNTESVNYNSLRKTLVSPTLVNVLGPIEPDQSRLRMVGDTLSADMNSSKMNIVGNVKANKLIRSGKKMFIRSGRAEISNKDAEAQFSENLNVDIDQMHITGTKAKFIYNSSNRAIEKVIVMGDVKVSDVEKWASSEVVVIFLNEDKYEMTGSPRVVQNNDELRGEKIVFLNGGKRIQVIRGKASVERQRERVVN